MHVEIWLDLVCPWCYIGKRRFESALAHFEHRDHIEIVWRSFELNPTAAPREGERLSDMMAEKFGMTHAQVEAMNEQMTALAREDGLDYRLDDAKPGNTFDAHRVIHLAARHELQGEMTERLMHAYFTEGRPIGDRDTLVELAADVGLNAAEIRDALQGDACAEEVRADERRASQFGIQGVPFFAIDEKYGISGAQPAAYIASALEHTWQLDHDETAADAADVDGAREGDACAPTGHRG